MALLERDRQLTQLAGALEGAAAGRGAIALISGEAGSGKTALLRSFLSGLGSARILRSYCEDLDIPDALGPLYDLARGARRTVAPRRISASAISVLGRPVDAQRGRRTHSGRDRGHSLG